VIIDYTADMTITCMTAISATYFATLEVSPDNVSYTPFATTPSQPIVLLPGGTSVPGTFGSQSIPIGNVYYRVRLTVTLANNCGTFNFLSVSNFICTVSYTQLPNRPPPDH